MDGKRPKAVSYTHLDVYKRQGLHNPNSSSVLTSISNTSIGITVLGGKSYTNAKRTNIDHLLTLLYLSSLIQDNVY